VRDVVGIELELLHHDDEARLAMLGCLPLVEPDADQLLMVDIGGGSTELLWLDRRSRPNGREPGHALSIPLGVVTLSESFGGGTDPETYAAMVEHVHARLSPATAPWRSPRRAGPAACRCSAPRAR
jgi:exopolyphosphatase/guanosine-5'-triphosphate,3'-diphosphate pyrophosphatase